MSAAGAVIVQASLDANIDPVTLSATGAVIVAGSLDATLDPITIDAAGTVESTTPPVTDRGGPAMWPW